MRRRTFRAFRFPLLLAVTLLACCGLAFGGWRYYNARLAVSDSGRLQQQFREKMQEVQSYYAGFQTSLFGLDAPVSYQVELWKAQPDHYRLEMTCLEGGELAGVQVVVFDGNQAYLLSPELDDFYPVHDLGRLDVPYLVLEDYWRSLGEADHFVLLSEEKGSRHSYYLVEVYPPEPHHYRVRELVWLEAQSLLPVRIEIYDLYDCLSQVTTFEILRINPALEATIFQVE